MAIKAYKERTLRFALNSETENDFDPRAEGKMNSLNVEVANVKIQKQIHHPSQMNPFCVINFEHTQSSALTQPMHGDNVFFGFSTLFPVKMTNELDRHLRTGKLVVTVADDSDSEIIYGYGKIPLASLALGEKIDQIINLETSKGLPCGTIHVILYWSKSYLDNPLKTATILEDPKIREEIEQSSSSNFMQSDRILGTLKDREVVESPKISARQAYDPKDTEFAATTAELEPLLLNDVLSQNSVNLKISKAKIFLNDPIINVKLGDVKQIFIGLELFNLPAEMLETSSMLLQNEVEINFGLDISYGEILSLSSQQIVNIYDSRKSEKLLLSLVDEPPAESGSTECKDIGFGAVELCKFKEESIEKIPILARDTKEQIGYVEMQIAGLERFYAYCQHVIANLRQ